jgi:transcriptional regulator with XRE-family HTH domain
VTQPVEYMSVGERIAIYRRRRGLSQLALANMVGRSEAWLSQVERGIRHADRLSVIIRLAQVLKVTVEDLTGQPLSLAPDGGAEYRAIPALRAALTEADRRRPARRLRCPGRDLPHHREDADKGQRYGTGLDRRRALPPGRAIGGAPAADGGQRLPPGACLPSCRSAR